ncbi:MAG TPA: L-lactate permease, partial [Steroidobacteraceae bacterium]|nr:L-lactate permease [Steroidobacteraceae bacterium]
MFHQLVTPIGGSLLWSCVIAAIPIVTVLVLLGVFRRPAWQASSAGLAAGVILAIFAWKLPTTNAVSSVLAGG